VLRIPVRSAAATVSIAGGGAAAPLASQVYAAGESVTNYQRNTNESQFILAFEAALPAAGGMAYVIKQPPAADAAQAAAEAAAAPPRAAAVAVTPGADTVIANAHTRLTFSGETGQLAAWENLASGIIMPVGGGAAALHSALLLLCFCSRPSADGSQTALWRLSDGSLTAL
jgi:hypothetical protein